MVTIGMVLYNEEKRWSQILRNVQILLNGGVSVILVDNASSDETRNLVTMVPGTQVLKRTLNHLGQARAQVVEAANTSWVGFLDADCICPVDWAEKLQEVLRRSQNTVSALGGPLLPSGSQKSLYEGLFRSLLGHNKSAQVKNYDKDEWVEHLSTSCVIYQREAVLKVGNFSQNYVLEGEDLELSARLRKKGGRLKVISELAVQHEVPSRWWPWMKKVFKYGRARGRVVKTWGFKYSKPSLFVLLYLLFCFCLVFEISSGSFWLLGIYLITLLIHSFLFSKVFFVKHVGYLISTHIAYSLGHVRGLCRRDHEATREIPQNVVSKGR